MSVFIEVKELLQLEQNENWEAAIELLYNLWKNDKDNSSKLCRLLMECWYVLSMWDFSIQRKELSFSSLQNNLIEATQYGLTHFQRNAEFLWIVGYAINMFPHFFYKKEDGDLYSTWEKKGCDMLFNAIQLEHDNLISQALYWGTQIASPEYINKRKVLKSQIYKAFPGDTAIEKYFREILL